MIEFCDIRDNGAAGVLWSHGTINRCAVTGNAQGFSDCDGVISDCIAGYNDGSGSICGHGFYACDGTIQRCTESSNRRFGLFACRATIRRTVISGNGEYGLH